MQELQNNVYDPHIGALTRSTKSHMCDYTFNCNKKSTEKRKVMKFKSWILITVIKMMNCKKQTLGNSKLTFF